MRGGQGAGVGQEGGEGVEGGAGGEVVDEDGAGGAAVVGARDAAEALGAGRVPQLELDAFAADADGFGGEFDADGLGGEDAPWWCWTAPIRFLGSGREDSGGWLGRWRRGGGLTFVFEEAVKEARSVWGGEGDQRDWLRCRRGGGKRLATHLPVPLGPRRMIFAR